MKDKNEIRPLKTNLIQQNCFIRDAYIAPETFCSPIESYVSIDEVTTEKGIELRETVHDYPITPEYVDSFSESASYKTDVAGAIAKSVSGKNLGDLRPLQDVTSMDMESARALYKQLSERFASASSSAVSTDTKTKSFENDNKEGDK